MGHDAYPTVLDRAAALLHSVARNHALVDGNKRLALAALLAFLGLNDVRLTLDNAGDYDLVTAVAAGELDDVPGIAARLGVATEPWTVDGRAVDGTASADPPIRRASRSRYRFFSYTSRKPSSVRSGSWWSRVSQTPNIKCDRPPVAMTTGWAPSSAEIRRTIPSTCPAKP